jgi:hypothetical protein
LIKKFSMLARLVWNISPLLKPWTLRKPWNDRKQILCELAVVVRGARIDILKASCQNPHGYWLTAMHLPGAALALPHRPTSQERNPMNSFSFGILKDSDS